MPRVTGDLCELLVLGGTGMLGHAVLAEVPADGLHFTTRAPGLATAAGLPGIAHAFEAATDDVGDLIGRLRPRSVVNALGIVKQVREADEPVPAISVNSLLPHELAQACKDVDATLIHVSTDCVFSGRAPLGHSYTESDDPDPLDLYGRSKLLGETGQGEALTLRTSIVGWELQRRSGLLEWFASQEGGRVYGFSNAIFSGLTTSALARVILAVLADHRDLTGVYHVASEPISKLDLITLLRDNLEIECEIEARDQPVVNRALDGSRFAAATGIDVPSWADMAAEYARQRSPQDVAADG